MAMAVMKLPAWQRRLAPVAVAFLAVGVVSTLTYFPGGPRLSGGAAGTNAPVTVGEEFHTVVRLDTAGRDVTVVKARVTGVQGSIAVDLPVLIRAGQSVPLAAFRGPLQDAYREAVPSAPGTGYAVVDLAGTGLRSRTSGDGTAYLLDVRLRPTAPGTSKVTGVEVTYQAGFLRTRTAVLPAPTCLHASENWRTDRTAFDRSCRPG